ncbi:MAG: thiamine-phosphate kinase, partial [Sphingopyxis sp.]|nr:thiamine-phosphate kinase [Sphingopyxis sp.]
LLIDAQRIAAASGVAIDMALDAVPLSDAWHMVRGGGVDDRIAAATMGDDYQLLFCAAPEQAEVVVAAGLRRGAALTRVGVCKDGKGLGLTFGGAAVTLPERLGFVHGKNL